MNLLRLIEKTIVRPDQSIDEQRKRTFLSFCIIISIPLIALFAVDDLRNERLFEGLFILFIIVVFVLNLFALKYVENMAKMYRFSAILVFSILVFELAIGGGDGYAFLWFYFFPIATFYLIGLKEGLVWVGLSIVISGFFFFSPSFYQYRTGIGSRFLVTYGIVSFFSFGIEFSREWYYKELMREKQMLENALKEVKTLSGLLPICASCKKIRDDKGYWSQIEGYIQERSDAQFSHGICPECVEALYGEELKALGRKA